MEEARVLPFSPSCNWNADVIVIARAAIMGHEVKTMLKEGEQQDRRSIGSQPMKMTCKVWITYSQTIT